MNELKRPDLRAHIARVAASLFYREGIHAVGVDRIADQAQVTKRTLYHHFASKDNLIAAALEAVPMIEFSRTGDPAERLLDAFKRLAKYLELSEYRGCPLIIYTAELADPQHPARRIVENIVGRRRAWFRRLAERAGAREPDLLAAQLDVLFDGALASGVKLRNVEPARAAIAAAETLIRNACVSLVNA